MESTGLFELKGALQHYAWGGYSFIPNLLGQPADNAVPVAELWMGTHHRGMAVITTPSGKYPLDEWLVAHPDALGEGARSKFGNALPFLFKVLDVKEMLSIQTHPTKAQAVKGYDRENAAGIPLDAPHRNFKDDNHKPEVMVALTSFWLLHGFRPVEEWDVLTNTLPLSASLKAAFAERSIEKLYRHLMSMPQAEVASTLEVLHRQLQSEQPEDKSDPGYWALRAMEQMGYDRGVFSIYLFNLLHLHPGQGIFQAAGIPHAYLEGVNVELMANSDNVFRGGLTHKHVDVPQLLDHIVLEAVYPRLLQPQDISAHEQCYPTPVQDFQLSRITLSEAEFYSCKPSSIELLLILKGKIISEERTFLRGQILLAPAGQPYELSAEQSTVIFKASVPL